jgi:CRISPR/Cas system CMR-associated protein Cmr5 small subunit
MDLERQISQKAIELVKAQSTSHAAEYRSFCERLPTLLRTAGLAQTLAFLRAKGGRTHGDVYQHMQEQFVNLDLPAGDGLLDMVVSPATGTPQYRFYSQVALRIAFWHKRLAQALLKGAE